MELQIDNDLKAVAEFMQAHVACGKLVSVARSISVLAPLLWGQHTVDDEELVPLRLIADPILVCGQRRE